MRLGVHLLHKNVALVGKWLWVVVFTLEADSLWDEQAISFAPSIMLLTLIFS